MSEDVSENYSAPIKLSAAGSIHPDDSMGFLTRMPPCKPGEPAFFCVEQGTAEDESLRPLEHAAVRGLAIDADSDANITDSEHPLGCGMPGAVQISLAAGERCASQCAHTSRLDPTRSRARAHAVKGAAECPRCTSRIIRWYTPLTLVAT